MRVRVSASTTLQPGVSEVASPLIDMIIARLQEHPLADGHSIAIEICGECGGRHDAGNVVVAEHQRPFDRPARQHDPFGANAVQPLARLMRGTNCQRQMILKLFDRQNQIHVVQRKRTCTRQQLHIGHALQFVDRGLQPSSSLLAADDTLRRRQKPAAQFVLFVEQKHFKSGTSGGECRQQSTCASTDDEDLDVPDGYDRRFQGRVPKVPCRSRRLA